MSNGMNAASRTTSANSCSCPAMMDAVAVFTTSRRSSHEMRRRTTLKTRVVK